jgi:hypothetical protein
MASPMVTGMTPARRIAKFVRAVLLSLCVLAMVFGVRDAMLSWGTSMVLLGATTVCAGLLGVVMIFLDELLRRR